jgi:hypothetical protein
MARLPRRLIAGVSACALLACASIASAQSLGYAHVLNRAGLAASSTSFYPHGVWRDGYTAAGDADPLFYLPSNSACSLGGGVGDGGSQVQSNDGKCWIAHFPVTGIDVREFGAACNWNGSSGTDDTTVIGKAESYVESIPGGRLYFPRLCVADVVVASNNVEHDGNVPSAGAAGGGGLVANSLTTAALTVNAVSGYTARNLVVTSKSQQTSGALVSFTGGGFHNLYDLFVTHGWDNVETSGVNVINIQGGGSRDFGHRAWYATALSTALFFANWVADEDGASSCGGACSPIAGFNLDYGGAVQFGNGVFIAHGHDDVLVNPVAGQFADWPEILPGAALDECDFSSLTAGGSNLHVTATLGGIVNGDHVGGWMGSCTHNVVITVDTGHGSSVSGVHFEGATLLKTGLANVMLTNAGAISFTGGVITGGSQSSTTTYPAIDLDGATSLTITGGTIGPAQGFGTGGGAVMKSAIQTESTFTGYVRCTGADASGNSAAGWTNAAATPDFSAVNCKGINGLGLNLLAPGGSPWTYTNLDGVIETLFVEAGTATVSGVGYSGHTICTTAPCQAPLIPGQSALITYSGGTPVAWVVRQ